MSESETLRLAPGKLVRPSRRTLAWVLVVALVESLLVVAYLATIGGEIRAPRYLLYPFVWINAAVLAVLVVDPPQGRNPLAAVLAAGYGLLLAWFAGVVSLHGQGAGFSVVSLPPGWGPTVVLDPGFVRVTLVPYQIVGYLGLTYLVYVLASRSLARGGVGVVGVLSCVSCTGSLAAAAGVALSGSSVLGVELAGLSHDLSTLAFLGSIGLLVALAVRTTPRSDRRPGHSQ